MKVGEHFLQISLDVDDGPPSAGVLLQAPAIVLALDHTSSEHDHLALTMHRQELLQQGSLSVSKVGESLLRD